MRVVKKKKLEAGKKILRNRKMKGYSEQENGKVVFKEVHGKGLGYWAKIP